MPYARLALLIKPSRVLLKDQGGLRSSKTGESTNYTSRQVAILAGGKRDQNYREVSLPVYYPPVILFLGKLFCDKQRIKSDKTGY
jgi:hypothetical protein